MKHLTIHIYGHVQGVFFRAHTQELARELGVRGYIRNEPDGSVHIEAEGDEASLKEFVEWCHKGPPSARVTRLQSHEGVLEGYGDFEIYHH